MIEKVKMKSSNEKQDKYRINQYNFDAAVWNSGTNILNKNEPIA
jgi:hypothetical protein